LAIVEFLAASLAGSDAAAADLGTQEREARLPLDLQNRVNELLLPLIGIGADSFFLNEHLGEGRSILDFPTLRAYDEDDFVFQERARADEDASCVKQPYLGPRMGAGRAYSSADASRI
jgi:hypothetical protein